MAKKQKPAPTSARSEKPPAPARDFLTGQLLIAMPNMADPRFEKSVILICAHDEQHAMGIVINKPIEDLTLDELLDQLDIDAGETAAEQVVFFGGPVQTERGLVVHTLDYRLPTTLEITDDIGVTGSHDILIDIAGAAPSRPAPQHYFLAIGYAGWSPDQLEEELAMNAWAHCDADIDLLFAGDREAAWEGALSKLGVTTAMLSPEWASPRPDDAPLN